MVFVLVFALALVVGCGSNGDQNEAPANGDQNDEHAGNEEWSIDRFEIVVPHALGGGQDALTRAFVDVWDKYLDFNSVRYEMRDGAGTRIGYDYFMQRPTDGSVIISPNLVNGALMYVQQEPGWIWEESLYPLGVMAVDAGVMIVSEDFPYGNFGQNIEDA